MISRPVIKRVSLQTGILTQITSGTGALPGGVLPAVLFHQPRPSIQNRMWGKMTEIEKEGSRPVPFNEADRLQVHPVHQILCSRQELLFCRTVPGDRLGPEDIWEKVSPIANTLDLRNQFLIEPMIGCP